MYVLSMFTMRVFVCVAQSKESQNVNQVVISPPSHISRIFESKSSKTFALCQVVARLSRYVRGQDGFPKARHLASFSSFVITARLSPLTARKRLNFSVLLIAIVPHVGRHLLNCNSFISSTNTFDFLFQNYLFF